MRDQNSMKHYAIDLSTTCRYTSTKTIKQKKGKSIINQVEKINTSKKYM